MESEWSCLAGTLAGPMMQISGSPSRGPLEAVPPCGLLGALRGGGAEQASTALAAFTRWLSSTPHFTHSPRGFQLCRVGLLPATKASTALPQLRFCPRRAPHGPKVTWASPQSQRPAASAGGLCSSLSSWLPPKVSSMGPGH